MEDLVLTPEGCLALMQRHQMPPHIIDHSRQVARIAVFLASLGVRRGLNVNAPLVEAAALVHDITKVRAITTHEDHAATGGDLLEGLGYRRMGEIVAQHVVLHDYDGPLDEAALVNYADKRVNHDAIVTLEQRFAYLFTQYGKFPAAIEMLTHLRDVTAGLEKRLFDALGENPSIVATLATRT